MYAARKWEIHTRILDIKQRSGKIDLYNTAGFDKGNWPWLIRSAKDVTYSYGILWAVFNFLVVTGKVCHNKNQWRVRDL